MSMPQLNVTIPEELNQAVRKKAGEKYGAAKNSISLAVVEALSDWIKKAD